jgi:cytochrome c5
MLWIPALRAGEGDAKAGKAVYTKSCATCQGAEDEGKPALDKALKAEMRHLGSKQVQEKTDAQLRKDTVEGTGKMKPVKGLSDKDLVDLIAYMRSLAKK